MLGLFFSMLIPFPVSVPVSGLLAAHICLVNGMRAAALVALGGGAGLAVLAVAVGAPVAQILFAAIIAWLPVILLAGLMRQWRSLTLTLQVSVIAMLAGLLIFFVVTGNPTAYWNNEIDQALSLFRDSGLTEYADWLEQSRAALVPQMSMLLAFMIWTVYAAILLLGNGLYQSLAGGKAAFGRFRDLNFGRVLAATMAVASVLALVTRATWLENLAFVAFVAFWLQGLAMLHWLRADKRLPTILLVVVYAGLLAPLVNGMVITALAIAGYMDAWFDFRARAKTRDDKV